MKSSPTFDRGWPMSRVGKRIIILPEGTTVTTNGFVVEVTGKLGSLKREFSPLIAVSVNGSEVSTSRANEDKHTKQLHGTTNSHIQGMVIGVTEGYKKEIIIKGVGYKSALKGDKLEIIAGYSHPVLLNITPGVKIEVPKPVEITITGIDKQAVGHMAAVIRDVRRPNPYSGKGIMYKNEIIKRKEGKAAAK